MAKASAIIYSKKLPKKTSQGRTSSMIKTSSMNKGQRRGYKKYRGQGR